MLASINPLGERARNNRFSRTATAYVIGSAVGGFLVGAAAGSAGVLVFWVGVPSAAVFGLAAAASVTAAVVDARSRSVLPGPRRQVDDRWLGEYRGWVYGGGFGVQLGAAVTTRVNTATIYLMVVLAVLSGSVGAGALIGVTFGVVRSLPVLTGARVRDPQRLRDRLRSLMAWDRPARVLSVAASALLASGFVWQAFGGLGS